MADQGRMTNAVEGYRLLASDLADMWSDLASSVAAKVDADEYDADEMLRACARTARLSAQTGFLIWNEAMESARALSGRQSDRDPKESDEFYSPLPGATLDVNVLLIPENEVL